MLRSYFYIKTIKFSDTKFILYDGNETKEIIGRNVVAKRKGNYIFISIDKVVVYEQDNISCFPTLGVASSLKSKDGCVSWIIKDGFSLQDSNDINWDHPDNVPRRQMRNFMLSFAGILILVIIIASLLNSLRY